jgi:hypothetical protein
MDDAVCSNRGICDERQGLCECFLQWGSSNGANGFGSRGDCGHVTPFAEVPPTTHLRSRDASRNPFTPDSTAWEQAKYGNVKDATLWKRAKFGADRDHAARWREKVMIDNWPKRDTVSSLSLCCRSLRGRFPDHAHVFVTIRLVFTGRTVTHAPHLIGNAETCKTC